MRSYTSKMVVLFVMLASLIGYGVGASPGIYEAIQASGPQGGALSSEQRARRVWAVELVRERWGLYATPQQMLNAAWLVEQYAAGSVLPVLNGQIDPARLPVPGAGLPTASYPPPTTP